MNHHSILIVHLEAKRHEQLSRQDDPERRLNQLESLFPTGLSSAVALQLKGVSLLLLALGLLSLFSS